MAWQQVLPQVLLFRDSCNVYALQGPQGWLIIDAGSGHWLAHRAQLGGPIAALLLTHYFRDHSAGAAAAAAAGIPVYAPEGEREIIADPLQHFRQRETYIIYDNHWDLFAPLEPTPLAGVLRDYERLQLAGLTLAVVPLPGVTVHQVGLAVDLPASGKVIFCAEAIHSPGRLARIAPLQYNYNDLPGAGNCNYSARLLRREKPQALLPSLGRPILENTDSALAQLQQNLRQLVAGRPGALASFNVLETDPLRKVTDHVWMTTQTSSFNWFVISDSGKALVIDYGYHWLGVNFPAYPRRYTRRALLHSLEGLQQRFGIDRVDVALISHFHDDHVCAVPVLQRLMGTQCWASETFADLLAKPQDHCFPCNWPHPIRIDRRLPATGSVQWEEYTFHLAPMNGHTRFASLIAFEADGRKFAHTGDQYFFQNTTGPWDLNAIMQNHVYRNGALLDGYRDSGRWLLDWRPDIVLQGHREPFYTDEHFFTLVGRWSEQYQKIHQDAMALGDDEAHFDLDSWGGWIWPYRTHLAQPGPAQVQVTVRNPLPRAASLQVRLIGPAGWTGQEATVAAPARQEVSCPLTITPDAPCRRQPFAAELLVDGQPYGQVAEALLTVGGEEF